MISSFSAIVQTHTDRHKITCFTGEQCKLYNKRMAAFEISVGTCSLLTAAIQLQTDQISITNVAL